MWYASFCKIQGIKIISRWDVGNTVTSSAACKNAIYANVDTSIKHESSCQSITVVKGYMYMFNVVDTALRYGRTFIVCIFLQESFKVK